MNIPTLSIPDVIRALEHYAAYMLATNRDDRPFRELAQLFKRRLAAKQQPATPTAKIVGRGRARR